MFTTIPQRGHFAPVVPLATALVDAGHQVAVATAETFRDPVEREGLDLVPAGIDDAEAWRQLTERYPAFLTESPAERGRQVVSRLFIETFAPALLADADRLLAWDPDIVIHEEGEFGGPLLAAMANAPWVDHGWGPLRPAGMVEATARALAPLWESHGIPPHPLGGAYQWLYLDPCPPSLQFPHAGDVPVLHHIRPASMAPSPDTVLPAWMAQVSGRPAVYVTLGTVDRATRDLDFFRATIAALKDQDLEIIVTVGPGGDAAALGPQPSNVHVEGFVPQAAVLPRCVAAITNGGAGSTLGSLAAGVPLLIVPGIPPSQARNGQAVAAAGAGRVLSRRDVTVERLRSEVALLRGDDYRAAARRIASEIDAMPAPADVVPLIERLAAHRQPLVRRESARRSSQHQAALDIT